VGANDLRMKIAKLDIDDRRQNLTNWSSSWNSANSSSNSQKSF